MKRPLLQVLVGLVLVLLAQYFWNPSPGVEPDAETSRRQGALPQTYIEQARSLTFDETGAISDIVEATRADYFRQGDYSILQEPRFYSHSDDGKTWTASAVRGRLLHDEERLLLRKNVLLSHDQTGTRMETHALDIEFETRMARSERAVRITQGGNHTTADGLVASLEQETLFLTPNVESFYVPSP